MVPGGAEAIMTSRHALGQSAHRLRIHHALRPSARLGLLFLLGLVASAPRVHADPLFAAKVDYRTGRAPYSVAIGDLNHDGKPDLVTANVNTDSVSVLLGLGDGTFEAAIDYKTGSGSLYPQSGKANVPPSFVPV